MYGANKLYCEQLGRYYAKFYKQLAAEPQSGRVDFRGVRFPGLISALTVPSGGTSDYAPEMIHAAAKGEPYACFVRPGYAHPVHGDARWRQRAPAARVRAESEADAHRVQPGRRSARRPRRCAPRCCARSRTPRSRWENDASGRALSIPGRRTWTTPPPARDWGFAPAYDFERAFRDYLIPTIRKRYAK